MVQREGSRAAGRERQGSPKGKQKEPGAARLCPSSRGKGAAPHLPAPAFSSGLSPSFLSILLSFPPFMEPQGAAENASPGRSNKTRLCESDGKQIQEKRPQRKHPLEWFEKTNWKCKSQQTAKPSQAHERRRQQPEVMLFCGTALLMGAELLTSACAVAT